MLQGRRTIAGNNSPSSIRLIMRRLPLLQKTSLAKSLCKRANLSFEEIFIDAAPRSDIDATRSKAPPAVSGASRSSVDLPMPLLQSLAAGSRGDDGASER
jgi:hypothetical protein